MKTQRSKTEKLRSFLAKPEIWINLIGLALAVILGYRSLSSGNTNDYLQAVLAVLGILALGQVVVSYSAIQRDRQLGELSETFGGFLAKEVTAEALFQTRDRLPSLDSQLSRAKTVDALGSSLITLAVAHKSTLRRLRDEGATLRLLVSNPDNQYLQAAIAKRAPESHDAQQHADIVKTSLSTLRDALGKGPRGGSLAVKVSDFFPAYSYLDIENIDGDRCAAIELHLDELASTRRPIFLVNPSADPTWYALYKEQFDLLWERAREPKWPDASETMITK